MNGSVDLKCRNPALLMFETDGGVWRGGLYNFSYMVVCNMRVILYGREKPFLPVNKAGPEGLGLSP